MTRPAHTSSDIPQRLRALMQQHRAIISQGNTTQLKAAILDHLGGEAYLRKQLLIGLQENIPQELEAARKNKDPYQAIRGSLIGRLELHCGMKPEVAIWVVDTWAFALNLTNNVAQSSLSTAIPEATRTQTVAQAIRVAKTGPADFRSLEEAIKHAPSGARIVVGPGLYIGRFVCDKDLEIVGDPKSGPVILQGERDGCVVMRTGHLVIVGLHLRLHDSSSGDSAVLAVSQGMLVLENCVLEGSESTAACLLVEGAASHVVVRSCSFRGGARGLWFRNKSRGEIEQCDVYEVQKEGVRLQGQSNPVFRNCTIRESGDNAIWVHDGGKGRFENCQIHDTKYSAVAVQDANSDPVFTQCVIRSSESHGVWVGAGAKGRFESCQIHDTKLAGVQVQDANSNPLFTRCVIRNSEQCGVWVHAGGRGRFEYCQISSKRIEPGCNPVFFT